MHVQKTQFFSLKALLLLIAILGLIACTDSTTCPTTPPQDLQSSTDLQNIDLPPNDLKNLGSPPTYTAPSGFKKIFNGNGIDIWERRYKDASWKPDYVLVLDLTSGIALKSVFGDIVDPRPSEGHYGGPDPLIKKFSTSEWQKKLGDREIWFNCQPFNLINDPAQIAYGLVENRIRILDGADNNEQWDDYKLTLYINSGNARIVPFNLDDFKSVRYTNMIVGLRQDAPQKQPGVGTGRVTFGTGLVVEENGREFIDYRLLFIHITEQATIPGSVALLTHEWRATLTMSVDGGDSTKFVINNEIKVDRGRNIPHVLKVLIPN